MYGYRGSDSIAFRAASGPSARNTSQASERSADSYAARATPPSARSFSRCRSAGSSVASGSPVNAPVPKRSHGLWRNYRSFAAPHTSYCLSRPLGVIARHSGRDPIPEPRQRPEFPLVEVPQEEPAYTGEMRGVRLPKA